VVDSQMCLWAWAAADKRPSTPTRRFYPQLTTVQPSQ
jgi:hypothetical protein